MTRTDTRRFPVLFAAIAALLALFGALALPATAQAQDSTCTLNTGDLWCGEITVAAQQSTKVLAPLDTDSWMPTPIKAPCPTPRSVSERTITRLT